MDAGARPGRYVVGVDGSAPSRTALLWALVRAARDRAPLLLVHATDDREPRPDAARDRDRGDPLAAAAAEVRAAGAEPEARRLEGPLPWSLSRIVTGRDTVVVGTHKTGFLHGRVLGSRSVQVALAVPCSVAVVPDLDLRFRRGIIAGLDRAATAGMIAAAAAHEAELADRELLLLHAGNGSGGEHDAILPEGLRAAAAAAPAIGLQARRSHREPAEALLDGSRDKALLVLGPGSIDPTRAPIGSVLHDVLVNANAPVLVARGRVERESTGPVAGRRRPGTTSQRTGVGR